MKKSIIVLGAVIIAAVCVFFLVFNKMGLDVAAEKIRKYMDDHDYITYDSIDVENNHIVISGLYIEQDDFEFESDKLFISTPKASLKADMRFVNPSFSYKYEYIPFKEMVLSDVSILKFLNIGQQDFKLGNIGLSSVDLTLLGSDVPNIQVVFNKAKAELIMDSKNNKDGEYIKFAAGVKDVDVFIDVLKEIDDYNESMMYGMSSVNLASRGEDGEDGAFGEDGEDGYDDYDYDDYDYDYDDDSEYDYYDSYSDDNYSAYQQKYIDYANFIISKLKEMGLTHLDFSIDQDNEFYIKELSMKFSSGLTGDLKLDDLNLNYGTTSIKIPGVVIKGFDIATLLESSVLYASDMFTGYLGGGTDYINFFIKQYISPITLKSIDIKDFSIHDKEFALEFKNIKMKGTFIAGQLINNIDSSLSVKLNILNSSKLDSNEELVRFFKDTSSVTANIVNKRNIDKQGVLTETYVYDIKNVFKLAIGYNIEIDKEFLKDPRGNEKLFLDSKLTGLDIEYKDKGLKKYLPENNTSISFMFEDFARYFIKEYVKVGELVDNFYSNPDSMSIKLKEGRGVSFRNILERGMLPVFELTVNGESTTVTGMNAE